MDEEYDVIVLGTGLTVSSRATLARRRHGSVLLLREVWEADCRPNPPASVPRHSRKDDDAQKEGETAAADVHLILQEPTIARDVNVRRRRPGFWCRCCVTPCSIF